MRTKIDWVLLKQFDSEQLLEEYLLISRYPPMKCNKSNQNNCKICSNLRKDHKMKVQYLICSDKNCQNRCDVRYLIQTCPFTDQIMFYQHNSHSAKENSQIEEKQQKTIYSKRGIKIKFKQIIENYMQNNILMPYIIHKKLLSEYTEKEVPNLSQIQSYVKYRRAKFGQTILKNSLKRLKYLQIRRLKLLKVSLKVALFKKQKNRLLR